MWYHIDLRLLLVSLVNLFHLIQCIEREIYGLESLEVGKQHDTAWFRFRYLKDGRQLEVGYSKLEHSKDIFAGVHESTSYMLKSKNTLVSMTLWGSDSASITILDGNRILSIKPTQIETPPFDLRRKLGDHKHYLIIQMQRGSDGNWCKMVTPLGTRIEASFKPKPPATFGKLMSLSVPLSEPDNVSDTTQEAGFHALRRLQTAAFWEDCFPGQENTVFLDIGLMIDYSFRASYYNDTSRALHAIEAILSSTNLVYYYQFNIFVRVRQVVFAPENDSGSLTVGGVLGQTTCGFSIGTMLTAMGTLSRELILGKTEGVFVNTEASSTEMRALSHWHVLTACFPSGTVGVAYVDTLCDQALYVDSSSSIINSIIRLNVAVSSRTAFDETWLTFAHELGHAFGATHSFEEGEGRTGGIMDYGDGKYQGIYQFNEKYRRTQMCTILTDIATDSRCRKLSQVPGEDDVVVDHFSASSSPLCAPENSSCLDDAGICIDGVCTLLELRLRVEPSSDGINYEVKSSEFGYPLSISSPDKIETKIVIADPLDACTDFSNPSAYAGKIVLIERGDCLFYDKAIRAELAGALAVVIFNNDMSNPEDAFVMASPDGINVTMQIPAVMISYNNGNSLLSLLAENSGLNASLTYGPVSQLMINSSTPVLEIWMIAVPGAILAGLAIIIGFVLWMKSRPATAVAIMPVGTTVPEDGAANEDTYTHAPLPVAREVESTRAQDSTV